MINLLPLVLVLTACGDSLLGPEWTRQSREHSQQLTIEVGSYYAVVFSFDDEDISTRRNHVLSGDFYALDGSAEGIHLDVVDEQGYERFRQGHTFEAFFSRKSERPDRFVVPLPKAETYYVLFSNFEFPYRDKAVSLTVELTYETKR